ncbi:MAG TPA: GNAT family N-acetyltransferase [Candidatus Binatus sp.]|nr:GNAT family N-acetyltransferase [Candidatus Binatus sp.]
MKSKDRLRIRPAVRGDKQSVLELCKRAAPWDYIPKVWDEWITDKNGRIAVATINDQIVGTAHAYLQTSRTAWLEGVRVDPSHRGKGIAGKLNKALVNYSAKRGASVARLCTGADNVASQKHLAKTGFKLLQSYTRYSAKKPLTRRPASVAIVKKYDRSLWSRVRTAEDYKAYRGMYTDAWTWYPMTWQSLSGTTKNRTILKVNDRSDSGVSIVLPDEKGLTIAYISGTKNKVGQQARYARFLLSKRNPGQRVRAVIPNVAELTLGLRTAGFTKVGATLVYEERIKKP